MVTFGTGAERDPGSGGRPQERRRAVVTLLAGIAGLVALTWLGAGRAWRAAAQERIRTVNVSGRRYAFQPDTIEVRQDELIRIVFRAEDVPHSFTIDEYRIAKRAGAGQTVTFEFRADRAGRFTYYCNMKSDQGCRDMRGTLVVHPR